MSDERYKLIHFYGLDGNYDEMYDLKRDPDEVNNIISDAKYAKIAKRLQKELCRVRKEQNVTEF